MIRPGALFAPGASPAAEPRPVDPKPDRYAHLRVVGAAEPFRRGFDERLVDGLEAGAPVHVLLDDGRVVETTLRYPAQYGERVWVDGIVGFYHHSRVRPVGGWDE